MPRIRPLTIDEAPESVRQRMEASERAFGVGSQGFHNPKTT